MKLLFVILVVGFVSTGAIAQSNFFEVNSGNGNGLRFWGSGQDNWKIHMGNTAEYHYGGVWDYSIKFNMDATSGRGWTWGQTGATPVAALTNYGALSLASGLQIAANNPVELGAGITKEANAGKISYQQFSDALDIVGAGTTGSNRKIKFWNEGGAIFTGNVGLGTSSPASLLHLSGGNGALIIQNPTGGLGNRAGINFLTYPGSGTNARIEAVDMNGFNADLAFLTDGDGLNNTNVVERMRVTSTGNVGIGTTTPDQKLTVNGTVHATRVKVEATVPGPDYVFEKDYSLPSLNEIKSYIDENKHLPEVPSAKEMAIHGIDVEEMNMLLLKKVEELTLHLIDQNKKLERLESELNAVKESKPNQKSK